MDFILSSSGFSLLLVIDRPRGPVHSSFTSVLNFAGLSSLLSEQSTDADDNKDNINNSREKDVITTEFVGSTPCR